MKKLISTICCFTIILSLISFAPTVIGAKRKFQDVSSKSWYATAVAFTCDYGLMQGVSNRKFEPECPVSRAMLATVLYRMSGSAMTYKYSTFKDNPKRSWYFNGVEYCSRNGIVKGYGNGYFGAEDFLTREDMMTMFYRFADFMGLAKNKDGNLLSSYRDTKQVSSYARVPINWCLTNGIVDGVSYSSIAPKEIADRSQLAQILMNFSERVMEIDVSPYRKTADNPYGIALSNIRLHNEELSFRLYGLADFGKLTLKLSYKAGSRICGQDSVTISANKVSYLYNCGVKDLYYSSGLNAGAYLAASLTVELYDGEMRVLKKTVSLGKVYQQPLQSQKLYFKGEKELNSRILLYHEFVEEAPPKDRYGAITTPERFEQDIRYILERGYTFISLQALLEYNRETRALPEKTVILTFDDGYESNYSLIYPILKKYDIPATIFVVVSSMNQPGKLTWDQMREMEESGLVDIQSHSWVHEDHSKLDDTTLKTYVRDSFDVLEQQLGKGQGRMFAYPHGKYTQSAIQSVADLGVRVQVSTQWKALNMSALNMSCLPRITVSHNSDIATLLRVEK